MKPIFTKKGNFLSDIISGLQKGIRRGNEALAMTCAVELWESNFDAYLWRRLKIIASEDIGLADVETVLLVHSLFNAYESQKKESKKNPDNPRPSERMFLTHAIIAMCRSQKSRTIDHIQICFFRNHKNLKRIELPEYVFDKHTQKGRAMGRGVKHFFESSALLVNEVHFTDDEAYLKAAQQAIESDMESEKNTDSDNLELF